MIENAFRRLEATEDGLQEQQVGLSRFCSRAGAPAKLAGLIATHRIHVSPRCCSLLSKSSR